LTHARKLKNKYFTNTDRTVLHLNYTKMLIIKDSFVPIFMMNVMTEFSLVFFPFCGRSILTALSFGFICISIVRLSRVGSPYLDIFSKEGWYCIQIYHVWEGYLRKIPVERQKFPEPKGEGNLVSRLIYLFNYTEYYLEHWLNK
jgi:hypothetical protein